MESEKRTVRIEGEPGWYHGFSSFNVALPLEIGLDLRVRRLVLFQLAVVSPFLLLDLFVVPFTIVELVRTPFSTPSWLTLGTLLLIGWISIHILFNTVNFLRLDGGKPILVVDTHGFVDRRVSDDLVRWDMIQAVKRYHGRGGFYTKVTLAETARLRYRPFYTSIGMLRVPRRRTFFITNFGLQHSGMDPALVIYGLAKQHLDARAEGGAGLSNGA